MAIKYENQSGEETSFWIAIKDINPQSKLMYVDIYNVSKTPNFVSDYHVFFDKIKQAVVLEGSFYEKQTDLISKIKSNLNDFLFLEYKDIDEKILNYYLECYNHDNEPFQTEYTMLEGIDADTFIQDESLSLDSDGYDQVMSTLKSQLHLKIRNNAIYERIVLNYLSVFSPSKGIIPIAYFTVLVDIKNKKLVKDSSLEFSPRSIVFSPDNKVFLQQYTEIDFDYFKSTFHQREREYIEGIKENLAFNEKVDQRPYFMKIATRYSISIKDEYASIQQKFKENKLTFGLASFFGQQANETVGRKSIIVDSKLINTNQLRTIYNAINQKVLFVQGPPGTGKTVSIVNIIHSTLFNEQTALLCTNNNDAVDNVTEKIDKLKYKGVEIRYPYIRLGSDLHIAEAIEKISGHFAFFGSLEIQTNTDDIVKAKRLLREQMQPVSTLISDFEIKTDIEKNIDVLNQIIKMVKEDTQLNDNQKASQLIDLEAQIQHYHSLLPETDIDEKTLSRLTFDEDLVREYLYFESMLYGKRLLYPKNKPLADIIKNQDKKERLKLFKEFIKTDDGFSILTQCFPIIASTNISVLKIGNPNKLFDLLIMEEASQCSTAIALIPMNRCKRACFIGDPNQLQPVVNITEEKNDILRNVFKVAEPYNYRLYSVLNSMLKVDSTTKFILLKKHYRCAKKIINFSNRKYYNEQLEIETQEPTKEPLKLITVENSASAKKNTSMSEVNAILEELRSNTETKDIAIIAPFRNQVNLLRDVLQKNGFEHVQVDTVYGFQGQEKDKIIFSSAISEQTGKGTFEWLKNNKELINVMSTRSKHELVVVADVDRIKELSGSEMNDLFEFVTYVEKNGNSEVVYQGDTIFDSRVTGYKVFNTDSEAEFIRTIAQLKSTTQKFTFTTKVRIQDVLDLLKIREEQRDLFRYGITAHFDFVLFDYQKKPLLAVEICGEEHLNDPAVMAKDLSKVKICIEHNLKILPIMNEDVRRYKEIKEAIIQSLSDRKNIKEYS